MAISQTAIKQGTIFSKAASYLRYPLQFGFDLGWICLGEAVWAQGLKGGAAI